MRATSISINQTALKHNLQQVRQLAPHSKIISMVKANAYGHGIAECLPALQQSDVFGVCCLQEALAIRQLGYQQDIILIEGVFAIDEMPIAIQEHCHCVIHHQQQLDWLLQYAEQYQAQGLKVWVKFNSGMNRLGFKRDEIEQVLQQLLALNFSCVLLMHFANADEPSHPLNQQQIQQFLQLKQQFPQIEYSCCNSAGILNWADLHLDYVRPGIMLYGASPFADKTAQQLNLRPVMQFSTEIIAIYPLKKGDSVGYGSSVTATEDMTLAIIAVGYGDGYPRAYQQQNFVVIAGQKVPLFGRVSMDMSMVNITPLLQQGIDVKIGTSVELWGEQLSVDDVAQANGTIGYELLCRVTERAKRIIIPISD